MLKISDNQGFSLVELLMAMAVVGILLVAIQAMLVGGMNVFNRAKSDIELRSQLYVVTEEIGRWIRNTPAQKIQLLSTAGVYNSLVLDETIFYQDGDRLYRRMGVNQRVIAEKIAEVEFSVIANQLQGVFDSYNSGTLRILDSTGLFEDRDPDLKGMVIRFENDSLGSTRYIYRKIVDRGSDWIQLDQDFTPGFSPTNFKYAIGHTYQIRIKTLPAKGREGVQVITGVKPRL